MTITQNELYSVSTEIPEGLYSKPAEVTKPQPIPELPIAELLAREVNISWRFIQYNVLSTIVPGTMFLVVALIANQVDMRQWLGYISLAILYFWFFVYTFDLSNQYVGRAEDKINKPSRPIPSKLVTVEGTLIRWVIISAFYLLTASAFGVLFWACMWLFVQILHNYAKWSWHWLGKNALMGVGVFVELAAAWQLVAPLNPTVLGWITTLSIVLFVVVAVQDLRDIPGDHAVGRRTMPIALGEMNTRWFLSVALGLIPTTICAVYVQYIDLSILAYAHWVVMVLLCFSIAYRILLFKDKRSDAIAYRFLVIWYIVALTFGIWVV